MQRICETKNKTYLKKALAHLLEDRHVVLYHKYHIGYFIPMDPYSPHTIHAYALYLPKIGGA